MLLGITQHALHMMEKCFSLFEEDGKQEIYLSISLAKSDIDDGVQFSLGESDRGSIRGMKYVMIASRKVYLLISDEHLLRYNDHVIHFDEARKEFIPLKIIEFITHPL